MPFIPIKKIKRGPGPRPPGDQPGLMAWVKKELWWLLSRTSVVVDWAVDYLGKVGIDATDEPDVAENKIVGSSTATVTKIGPDGYHQLQIAANAQTIIQQIPVAAPDPEATSKLLFPALILDPLNMGNVTCVFGLETCGYQTFDSQWTQDGTAFIKDDAGALAATGDWFDGVDSETYGADGYSTLVGKLVITPPSSELSRADQTKAGVFVIEDTGGHYEGTITYDPETGSYVGTSFVQTQARLRRVATLDESSEFVQYMTYYVEEGDNYAGFYGTLQNASVTLGGTEQTWTFSATHSWTDSYELLSSAQLTSRGASSVSTDMGITVSSPGTTLMSPVFPTPTGSPGITTLPAGTVKASLKDVAISASQQGNGTYNKIVAYLYDWDRASSYTSIVSWTSENIDWVNARDIEWEGSLASDYGLAAGHAVVLRYYLYTDSTTSVAISFTYNSFDRYTKIEVPWSNAIFGGTNEHNDLHGLQGGDEDADERYHLPNVRQPHGWPIDESGDRLATLSYDAGTRKVTITAAAGDVEVWVHGVKFSYSSPYVSEAHAATEGEWFLYHDDSGFSWSQTAWNLFEDAPTAQVYYSSVGSTSTAFGELHGWMRDLGWHREHHSTEGTQLATGGVLGDYTIDDDADASIQFSISAATIIDEDLLHTLTAKSDGGGFTIWRRSGASGYWTWSTGNSLPFLYSTYPQRNYDAGGGTGWTMADVSGLALGEFVTAYVVATPALSSDHRFVILPGQTAYASLDDAIGEAPTALSLGTLPFEEWVPIAQLVFHARSTYGGSAKAVLAAVTRLTGPRGSFTSTSSPTAHNALAGLQGGTSTERFHLPENERGADVKFVSADWDGTGTSGLQDITELVYTATEIGDYRLRAVLFIDPGDYFEVSVGGTATATCELHHAQSDYDVTGTISAATAYENRGEFSSTFGDGGKVTSGASYTYLVRYEIEGMIHVTAVGTIAVRFNPDPIDYHEGYILTGSYREITKVTP